MGQDVWLRKDRSGNKVRLVDSRQVDITELINHSCRVTLQKQLKEIVGKIVLADSEGLEIPLAEILTQQLGIAKPAYHQD